MKRGLYLTLFFLATLTTVTCCNGKTPKNTKAPTSDSSTNAQPAISGYTGNVVETINTSGYTYVQVDTGSEKIWAAAPEFQVKVGDEVTVPKGMPMKNYHSKTLDRTFDVVYFAGNIVVAGTEQATSQLTEEHPGSTQKNISASPSANVDFSEIKKPGGGKTIAEIYNEKGDLAGKEVMVRAKVVKFSSNIMGKNWIHLQDGTGTKGTDDLTVTTATNVKVGDTVLVSGMVVINRDFGSGYKYDVIIEDAKVTIE